MSNVVKCVYLSLIFLMHHSCGSHVGINKVTEEKENKSLFLTEKEVNDLIAIENQIAIDSIGILVYDGFFNLDAFGPHSVFSGLIGTEVLFIAQKKGKVKTSSGIEILVNNSIDEVEQLDILIIPGGTTGTVNTSKNEKILNWIRKIDSTSTFTTSVCTGAWILGEAGLLKNKKATTNWYRAKDKIESYGGTFLQERYVRDGKLWTSAGVSAGIDMSLAMVNTIKGETYTKLLMLNLEYDPKPPVVGGSVSNTNKGLVNYMAQMYDSLLEPKANTK